MGIVCCLLPKTRLAIDCPLTGTAILNLVSPLTISSRGLLKDPRQHTNAINAHLNPRTHDLVPAVYTPDQPSRTFEAARAAEGVREAGVGGEVFFEGGALGGGWGLREEVDYLGDLGFWRRAD